MDTSRILPVLLLLTCIFTAASSLSDRNGPNVNRHIRRIALNEFLVPPPPPSLPRPHPPIRTGRLVSPRPTEAPGYFSKFMSWLNPFSIGTVASPPPIPPPHSEAPFPPPPKYLPAHPPQSLPPNPPSHGLPSAPHSGPPFPVYNAPPPLSYNGQNAFPPQANGHHGYLPPNRGKACNPCNKVPWIPMQNGEIHSENPSYGPPPPSVGEYLPPNNHQTGHDIHHAASHEVRTPDFTHLPLGQNTGPAIIGPLPNPHLYPGPMPPLYKAEPFDRPSHTSDTGNTEYLGSTSLHGNGIGTNHQTSSTIPQEYGPPVRGNAEFDQVGAYDHRDLASSGTQLNQGHVSAIPSQSNEVNKETIDYKGSFGTSVFDHQIPNSGQSNDQGYQDSSVRQQEFASSHSEQDHTFASFGSSHVSNSDFVNHGVDQISIGSSNQGYPGSLQTNSGIDNVLSHLSHEQNPPNNYGTSSFDNQGLTNGNNWNYQRPDDLSSSGSIVENLHVTIKPSILSTSSSTVENPVHFEQSPLLDLTKKDESPADTKWITSTENTIIDFDGSYRGTGKTTTNYHSGADNSFFENQDTRPTELYTFVDQSQTAHDVVRSSVSAESNFSYPEQNQNLDTSKTFEDNHQDVSYIPPSAQPGYLWPSLLPSTSKPSDFYHDVPSDSLASSNINVGTVEKGETTNLKDLNKTSPRQQGVKRNKQVQVIIPYTSDYTPIPFHQTQIGWGIKNNLERTEARKVPPLNDRHQDNYVSEESRSEIRVLTRPELQYNFSATNNLNVQSTTSLPTTTESRLRNISVRTNNSIDVHRLQKNIDNWTIQEYSRVMTSSTVLPSSVHPYLLPSKKIPNEYLTTTEPGNHADDTNDHENVKTYSLAGFSFNDLEHEESASNQVEGARVQVIRVEEPKQKVNVESNSSVPTPNDESTWKDFSVSFSPLNKERVYVVTPQTASTTTPRNSLEKVKEKEKDESNSKHLRKPSATNTKKSKGKLSEFEAIERAYQVLPQAVNNLAVASTGKEGVPLWGIMEHEEFASLNIDNPEEGDTDVIDGPVLYAGHSKVSRARR